MIIKDFPEAFVGLEDQEFIIDDIKPDMLALRGIKTKKTYFPARYFTPKDPQASPGASGARRRTCSV